MQHEQTEKAQAGQPASCRRAGGLPWLRGLLSDQGLTRKAYLNGIAAALDYGARLLVGLLVNPMLVHGLGDYLFGTWQVLTRTVGYFRMLDGRPTQALKWTVANYQALEDGAPKRRAVSNALGVWLVMSPLLLMVSCVLVWALPGWLKSPPEYVGVIRWAVALMMLNLSLSMLADIPEAILRGQNLQYKRMGLSALVALVTGVMVGAAVWLDLGIVGASVATVVGTLIDGLYFMVVVRAFVPWLGLARTTFVQIRGFLGLSLWFTLWSAASTFLFTGDIVLLGFLSRAEDAASYSLNRFLAQTIVGIIAIVVGSVLPGLGGIIGSGDLQRAAQVRDDILGLAWTVLIALGTTILLWNGAFVRLWVGQRYYGGILVTALIVIMNVQFTLLRLDANIIDLSLDLRRKVLLAGAASLLIVMLSVLFVVHLRMGMEGILWAWIIGQVPLNIGYPGIVGRFLRVPRRQLLQSMLRPTLAMVVLYGAAIAAAHGLAPKLGWIGLTMAGGLTCGVVAIVAFYAAVARDSRQRILRRLFDLVGVRGKGGGVPSMPGGGS